jgi:hypothetical protein
MIPCYAYHQHRYSKYTVLTAYYSVFSNYCITERCSAHLLWPFVVSCQIITGKQHKGKFTRTMPFPCRSPTALIHTCHAAPLPFSDSAVSLVKIHVIDGNTRTASPATALYSNNLRGTPRGIRKKSNAGRSFTCCFWTAVANSHIPCLSHAAPMPRCAPALSSRCQNGLVVAWHGNGTSASLHVWIKHGRTV